MKACELSPFVFAQIFNIWYEVIKLHTWSEKLGSFIKSQNVFIPVKKDPCIVSRVFCCFAGIGQLPGFGLAMVAIILVGTGYFVVNFLVRYVCLERQYEYEDLIVMLYISYQ